jgi:D-alanine-D-alanine ligase
MSRPATATAPATGTLDVLVLYNEPTLAPDHPDWASEAGVLESVEAVVAGLEQSGHRPTRMGLAGTISKVLEQLRQLPPADVVFNLFEGLQGVSRGEAEVTGLIELLGYRVTGSPAECLGLVRHKPKTKWLLAGAGLPTAPFELVPPTGPLDEGQLRRLLGEGAAIVKPAHEDASLGIDSSSIVRDWPSLVRQVEAVRARYGAVLVERFIVGREFNVAIVALPEPRLLPLAEIEFSGPGPAGWQIVTYEAKWAAGSAADRSTPPVCPARVEDGLAARIGQVALDAFCCAGCRQYARVDLRVDAQGNVFVLEINGNPDIGPSAGFARALRAGGMDYATFVDQLVRTA